MMLGRNILSPPSDTRILSALLAKPIRWMIVLTALLALQGCSLTYFLGSASGHLNLISSARPVDKLLDDPSLHPVAKAQLATARDIRQFAIDELALPDNGSYRKFVDTGRQYVTWAVFAAPELSLAVRTWCFPVTGCVPYRGYFSEAAAERFADGLRKRGYDVYVAGVPAYSTLGFFADPLLNTMFGRGETYLAATVFHELAHQEVYVAGDAVFNESFAAAVEEAGVEKWLRQRGETAALRRYHAGQKIDAEFVALVTSAREKLHAVYTSNASDEEKRAEKAAVITDLRARYRRLRDGKWKGFNGYDRWFDAPINNAKLAPIAVYSDLVPAFRRLLQLCRGDYARFYRAVERIGTLDPEARRQALISANSCS